MLLLLKIPIQFDLEVYTTSRKEKHLHSLLRVIKDIVEKQSKQQSVSIYFFIMSADIPCTG